MRARVGRGVRRVEIKGGGGIRWSIREWQSIG